jgi:hypothetical protein
MQPPHPMADTSQPTDNPHHPWQFSLRGLFLLTLSVALGLSYWKAEQDWYVGTLATLSFWIVIGLATQIRDIARAARADRDATTEERWGWRFAFAWRFAVCLLIGASFLLRLLFRFGVLVPDNSGMSCSWLSQDVWNTVSSRQIWYAVLLASLIAAIAGSCGFGRHEWRRPWSWGVYVFRGFAASALMLLMLENLLMVACLVHITIVGILLAQPLKFESDVVFAAGRVRVAQFYNIASTGVASVFVTGILLWQLSTCWRLARWRRVCVGTLFAASLIAMVLLTTRIIAVEIPTTSPIMTANINMPAVPQLAAAVILVAGLAAAIARRWSEPPGAGLSDAVWRRDEWGYYHERRPLVFLLGGIAMAKFVTLQRELFSVGGWRMLDWRDNFYLMSSPVPALSLVLVLVASQVVFSRWMKRSDTAAAEQPRLTPALFLTVWLVLVVMIVCIAPILGAWHFASVLRAGYVQAPR